MRPTDDEIAEELASEWGLPRDAGPTVKKTLAFAGRRLHHAELDLARSIRDELRKSRLGRLFLRAIAR